MRYYKIWISSVEHHQQLSKVVQNTAWFKKLLGQWSIPSDFPSFKNGDKKKPLPFFAQGELKIDTQCLTFEAKQPYVKYPEDMGYLNLKHVLSFQTSYNEIRHIIQHRPEISFIQKTSPLWLNIQNQNGMDDYLFTIGVEGFHTARRTQETLELFHKIKQNISQQP
jgi:hypothetical protein